MHFVLLHTEFSMNGAAVLLFRWARHLASLGLRVTGVHNADAAGPLRDQYVAAGIALTPHFRVEPDMVAICNTVVTAPYVIQVAAHVPTIWWLHEAETGLGRLIEHPEDIPAFTKASAIVIPSAIVRDTVYRPFLMEVPPARVHIVPPGFDHPDPSEIAAAARDKNGRLEVVCVGAIDALKRQSDLIRAVARLPDLPIDCVFAGKKNELEPDAASLAEAMPERFRFLGELPHPETMRLLAGADIFCHPSASECLPLAPLEAGLRAKPLILSDIIAHDGIWRHGVNCLMHPRADADLLAHMVRILATDPPLRARLGQAARETASAFRHDVFVTRLGMVLASLA